MARSRRSRGSLWRSSPSSATRRTPTGAATTRGATTTTRSRRRRSCPLTSSGTVGRRASAWNCRGQTGEPSLGLQRHGPAQEPPLVAVPRGALAERRLDRAAAVRASPWQLATLHRWCPRRVPPVLRRMHARPRDRLGGPRRHACRASAPEAHQPSQLFGQLVQPCSRPIDAREPQNPACASAAASGASDTMCGLCNADFR